MIAEVNAALKERLLDLPFRIGWPNVSIDPALGLYVQAQIEMTAGERLGMNGRHRMAGSLILTVVSSAVGTAEADDAHDAIAAAFPADLTIPLSSGAEIRITQAPQPRGGFRDGAYWRAPIVVPFEILT